MRSKARKRRITLEEVEVALRVRAYDDPDEPRVNGDLSGFREKTARLKALRLSNAAMSRAGIQGEAAT